MQNYLICNQKFALVGIIRASCAFGITITILWHSWLIELDEPRVLAFISNGRRVKGRALNLSILLGISSIHWSYLVAFWSRAPFRPLFGFTLWPDFSPWRFCVGHVIWMRKTVNIIRLLTGERGSSGDCLWSWGADLGTILCCGEGKLLIPVLSL